MALGEIAKQLAGQAIGDALQGGAPAPAAKAPAEGPGATIFGQIQAMQKALKEDQELLVLFTAGGETVRVLELFLPSPQVAVLTGVDKDKNMARAISPVESLQLVCKVVKAAAKPVRVSLVVPRQKPE
jgi:hypothetical protein